MGGRGNRRRIAARGRVAALLVAILCVGAGTIGPEAIAGGKAKSRVKLTALSSTGAAGVVKSRRGKCRPSRVISLHRHESFFTEKVATTVAGTNGKWTIAQPLAPGRYFASVKGTRGCRYAVSADVVLG